MNLEGIVRIRVEREEDQAAIHALNIQAFGGPAEGKLVDNLREAGALAISLVATEAEQVVGHIAFSRIEIVSGNGTTAALALAPMAVAPRHQKRGIGTMLVQNGVEACSRHSNLIVVVGHPGFYSRLGFIPARQFGIECPFPVAGEAFMVRELVPGAAQGHRGTIRYHAAFDELTG